MYINEAWEVHFSDENVVLSNNEFIDVALKLYTEKLNSGAAIRFVAPRDNSDKSLWNTYSRVIEEIFTKNPDKYQPTKPNFNYIDSQGGIRISQVIRPWGGKKGIEEALMNARRKHPKNLI